MMHSCCLEWIFVALRSTGRVLDPLGSMVSDAEMEIHFACRDWRVIDSSVFCCSWPWDTALGSAVKPNSGESAQICSCSEKPVCSTTWETSSWGFSDESWKIPFLTQWGTIALWCRVKQRETHHTKPPSHTRPLFPRNPKLLQLLLLLQLNVCWLPLTPSHDRRSAKTGNETRVMRGSLTAHQLLRRNAASFPGPF